MNSLPSGAVQARRGPPAAVLLAIIAPAAHGAVFTVGGDAACATNSLQAAIDAARDLPGPDVIRLASNRSYTAQALRIGQQDLVIEGGYADCTAASPTGSTIISGEGGSASPVFTITGSGVRDLRRLGIIRGDASPLDGEGGGISFAGSGELRLTSVAINQNRAAYGGGINFRGTASPAALTIGSGTTISSNTAQISGGGVRIEGEPARMFMLEPQTAVFSNVALGVNLATGQAEGGFGGGIQVLGGANADIASPGFGAIAAVQGNEAVRGGGIATLTNDLGSGTSVVRLYRRDAIHPTRIRGNRASATGGGLYVAPITGLALADACVFGGYIEDNVAANGAAVYLDVQDNLLDPDTGGSLIVRRWPAGGTPDPQGAWCGPEHPQELGAVPCAAGAPCNAISGNRVEGPGGAAASGAILLAQRESRLSLREVSITGNSATNVLRAFSDGATGTNFLIAGNTVSGALLRYADSGRLNLRDVTIAGNTIGGTHVVQADDARGGSIARSIIWQPGKLTLAYPGGGANAAITIDKSLVSDRSTLPDGPNYLNGEPRFNDPLIGDWRLRISSAAVDAALPEAGDDRDIGGDPRDQMIRPLPNELVRDAGAHERQRNAPLLVNGGFYGTLSQWSVRSAPYVTYDASTNDGTDGTGSVQLGIPIEVGAGILEAEVVSQCFNVPFPGTYRLTARAFASGTTQTRDVPKLNWRRRINSADCSGAATAQGSSFFPGSGGAWASATPVDIVVPEAGFGPGASIEVVLSVAQNAVAVGALQSRFDNVALTVVSGMPQPDAVFANGFEAP